LEWYSCKSSAWVGMVRQQPRCRPYTRTQSASLSFLAGVQPKDELEGMLAAQLLASHNAAMECYRRAMISEQTFEGRKENLNQANKLSRTHTTLLEALNRHRGKGQQKVTVEYVHVHEGGQAIVGNVSASCTTISAISTWSKKPCNPSTTRSARGCHPCLRYVVLPMCPGRTRPRWRRERNWDRTFSA
jgi:hypothetical protein